MIFPSSFLTIAVASTVVLIPFNGPANAELASSIEEMRAPHAAEVSEQMLDPDGKAYYVYAFEPIRDAFPRVLFSVEYGSEGWAKEKLIGPFEFRVLRNQRLTDALNLYCERTGENLTWRTVGSTVAIYPTSNSQGARAQVLDREVRISLNGASVNTALASLQREINSTGDVVEISSDCVASSYDPPIEFDEVKITLTDQTSTAREVLWAIVEQSPVPLQYHVFNLPEGRIAILVSLRDPETLAVLCGDRTNTASEDESERNGSAN